MSISLLEQKKKFKFLLPVLIGAISITLIIIWLGFFKKQPKVEPALTGETTAALSKKINIDWQALKNPILETLEPFETIPALQGSYGRKNPFLPY